MAVETGLFIPSDQHRAALRPISFGVAGVVSAKLSYNGETLVFVP
jgi:hypothetical protein